MRWAVVVAGGLGWVGVRGCEGVGVGWEGWSTRCRTFGVVVFGYKNTAHRATRTWRLVGGKSVGLGQGHEGFEQAGQGGGQGNDHFSERHVGVSFRVVGFKSGRRER